MSLGPSVLQQLCAALNGLLADTLALQMKTTNLHWHVSGRHFRDYRLLMDDQASQLFATTDVIAERVRKLGGKTIRSIGHVAHLQRLSDNDLDYVIPGEMLLELRENNLQLAIRLRQAHGLCDAHGDVASARLLETWIDEAEGRAWFLLEMSQPDDA